LAATGSVGAGPPDPGPSFWLRQDPYLPGNSLSGPAEVDIAIVGGGFTGLWSAIEIRRRRPSLRVAVLEQEVVGYGASGRNGGFCEPSLTHGYANGLRHFPQEIAELERLGRENFLELAGFIREHRIDCDFELNGVLEVATAPWQSELLKAEFEERLERGAPGELLNAEAAQGRLHSPCIQAALFSPEAAILNPARLARGLRRVAEEMGAVIWEGTRVERIEGRPDGVALVTAQGSVAAARTILATNAYSGRLLRRLKTRFVPVYDYVLASEPLSAPQRQAVGWARREGVATQGNHFHYFRLTADNRILWGGYDAIYHFGGRVGPELDHRPKTYARLEAQFRQMFPMLGELSFPHRWGGPIASTTRFTCTFGSALGGRIVYALGYTGLGVAASRFAARVLADRLLDPGSPLLGLRFVREPPFPFPPEPLCAASLTLVQSAMSRADRTGRRGPILRSLDRLGIGFDS
jgi:glycine/D-amino acid oxidase-like deaminating enzyme